MCEPRHGLEWLAVVAGLMMAGTTGCTDASPVVEPRGDATTLAAPLKASSPEEAIEALGEAYFSGVHQVIDAMTDEARNNLIEAVEKSGYPADRPGVAISDRGTLRLMVAYHIPLPLPAQDTNGLMDFLAQHGEAFGLADAKSELVLRRTEKRPGALRLLFDQVWDGHPVFGSRVVARVAQGGITMMGVEVAPAALRDSAAPVVGEGDALLAAAAQLGAAPATPKVTTGYIDPVLLGEPASDQPVRLGYRLEGEEATVYVDGATGDVVTLHSALQGDEDRETFWVADGRTLPGTLIHDTLPAWFYGSWPGSTSVCWLYSTLAYYYYLTLHGRDSWDNGTTQDHRWRISCDYDGSSSWNTDLKQVRLKTTDACVDVIAHEFTHGVYQADVGTAVSTWDKEVREGLCDAFGEFAEGYATAGLPDWEHATGGNCPTVKRTLHDPLLMNCPQDEQDEPCPDHWSDYIKHTSGQPDVHLNSHIISKGAWLLARAPGDGSVSHWGRSVSGLGIAAARDILYEALTGHLTGTGAFAGVRVAVEGAAQALYGNLSDEHLATKVVMESLGIWTLDVSLGVTSDTSVDVSTFTVNGEPRRYLFYTSGGSIYTRHRACVLYGVCSWSSPQWLADSTEWATPVTYGGSLWMFYTRAGKIRYRTLSAAGVWSAETDIVVNGRTIDTDAGVGAAVLGSGLYVFLKGPGAGNQPLKRVRYQAGAWGGFETTYVYTDRGVRTVSGGGLLWVGYRVTISPPTLSHFRFLKHDGSSYDGPYEVQGLPPADAPSLAWYRDRLHAAALINPSSYIYRSCSPPCTAEAYWTRAVTQEGAFSQGLHLSSGPLDGRLYTFFRPHGGSTAFWRWKASE